MFGLFSASWIAQEFSLFGDLNPLIGHPSQ
jgi:hypothetical protein